MRADTRSRAVTRSLPPPSLASAGSTATSTKSSRSDLTPRLSNGVATTRSFAKSPQAPRLTRSPGRGRGRADPSHRTCGARIASSDSVSHSQRGGKHGSETSGCKTRRVSRSSSGREISPRQGERGASGTAGCPGRSAESVPRGARPLAAPCAGAAVPDWHRVLSRCSSGSSRATLRTCSVRGGPGAGSHPVGAAPG